MQETVGVSQRLRLRLSGWVPHQAATFRQTLRPCHLLGCQVREGRAPAPGMDPEAELRTLRLRFDTFRRDFKARLDMTAENLKRIDKEERKAAK